MNNAANEPVSEAAVIPRDWRAMAPGMAIMIGGFILVANSVISSGVTVSMIGALVGALMVIGGFSLVQAAPIFLVLPHLAVSLLLFLHAVGLCQSSCGEFASYQHLGGFPTSALGAAWHFFAFVAGVLYLQRKFITADVLRMVFGISQGMSLFFASILIIHGHWCPSCVASHAFMVAQAILVWRLSFSSQRVLWVATILIGALGTNAAFHHRYEKPAFGPSQELLGYLHSLRETNSVVIPVAAEVKVVGAADAKAPTANRVTPVPVKPEDTQRLGLLVDKQKLRAGNYSSWGSADAPVIIRAHMNLACNACRGHWRGLNEIRELINQRKASMQVILTWPISPEPHYGARLATYAVYSAGHLGEEELLYALDRFFSDAGLLFMNELHEKLLASMVAGQVPAKDLTDALIETFRFLEPMIPAKVSLDLYQKQRSSIDGGIQANINWLVKHGTLATPKYYFVKADQSDRSILDTSSLDFEVWKAFVTRSSP
jgi:uncharacterized membrane protein/protein-disulfide isomerase